MFFLRIVMMALRGLGSNLLRSLLATFGVIIGVAAVIAAMSILEGATRDIMDRFKSFGSEQIWVYPAIARVGGRASGYARTLTPEDADAMMADCPDTVSAAAAELAGLGMLKYRERNTEADVLGTTEHYADMNNYAVAEGRFLTRDDRLRHGKLVIVLGHRVARDLFGGLSPLDQRVRLAPVGLGTPHIFRVVGVMEKAGNIGFRNVDSQVVIPVTTAMRRVFGRSYVSSISVKARSAEVVPQCMMEIKAVLRRQHRLRLGKDDDFRASSQEEQLRQVEQVTQLFAIVFISIAGISLVVGGIGIMNIMLVSVTERTREIGVRIAVGAQRWDILRQFLIEAAVISLFGGAFGVVGGFLLSDLIEYLASEILETYTPPKVIAWALSMAILTGIVSGIYPAIKASRLDPVDALRYE